MVIFLCFNFELKRMPSYCYFENHEQMTCLSSGVICTDVL